MFTGISGSKQVLIDFTTSSRIAVSAGVAGSVKTGLPFTILTGSGGATGAGFINAEVSSGASDSGSGSGLELNALNRFMGLRLPQIRSRGNHHHIGLRLRLAAKQVLQGNFDQQFIHGRLHG